MMASYPNRTNAEREAGIYPTDYSYPPGDARRYGANRHASSAWKFYCCLLAVAVVVYALVRIAR